MAARIAQIPGWRKLTIAAMLMAAAGLAYLDVTRIGAQHVSPFKTSSQQRTGLPGYMPGTTKWASLRELEPIFSPYAGRVIRLPVKSIDIAERGQALFIVAANDAAEGMKDFISNNLPFGS